MKGHTNAVNGPNRVEAICHINCTYDLVLSGHFADSDCITECSAADTSNTVAYSKSQVDTIQPEHSTRQT